MAPTEAANAAPMDRLRECARRRREVAAMGNRLSTYVVLCTLACAGRAVAEDGPVSLRLAGGWSSASAGERPLYNGGFICSVGVGYDVMGPLTIVASLDYSRLPFNDDNDVSWSYAYGYGRVIEGESATVVSGGIDLRIGPDHHRWSVAPYLVGGIGSSRVSYNFTDQGWDRTSGWTSGPHVTDVSTDLFTTSLGIGVDLRVHRGIALSFEYRFHRPSASTRYTSGPFVKDNGYVTTKFGLVLRP
jgi:opacity protein-like surface antigen